MILKAHLTKIISYYLLALVNVTVYSQNLSSTIKVSNDTILVDSMITLSRGLFSSDPQKSILYSNEVIEIARKINYSKGEALGLKNIGLANYFQSKHVDALNYYTQSLNVYRLINDKSGMANLHSNIGVIYIERGDIQKALENYLESLKNSEQAGDKYRTLIALNNIGGAYDSESSTRDKALETFGKALLLSQEMGLKEESGDICINIGNIYFIKESFVLAKKYYEDALLLYKDSDHSLHAYNGLGKIFRNNKDYNNSLINHNKALVIAKKINNKLNILQTQTNLAKLYVDKKDFTSALDFYLAAESQAKEIGNKPESKDIAKEIASMYAAKGDFVNAYKYRLNYDNLKDSLSGEDVQKKLGSLQFEIDLHRKESEISLLTKDKAITEEKIKQQKLTKYALLGGLAFMLTLASVLFRGYRNKLRTNIILDKQKVEIESLLFNILPEEVAYELKNTGAATPRYYDNVSVMFTDFKGFTALADQLSPQEVIEELDENFKAFDNIIDKFRLEKIKTIGDAYMCAAGIPTPQAGDHYQIMRAALEIRDYVNANNKKQLLNGKKPWEIRIGIHMGPLVAGVVGKRKYAYDIWGNTVNIASRMETNVEPGNIAISAKSYEMVKDKFECKYKGKINAKNVGDIDMYYLESEKSISKLEFVS